MEGWGGVVALVALVLGMLTASCCRSEDVRAAVTDVCALVKRSDAMRFSLDSIGAERKPLEKEFVPVAPSGEVVVSGWAVDEPAGAATTGVEIVIDNTPYAARYGIDRPDVAQFFGISAYARSGFSYAIWPATLTKGNHRLSLRIISADKRPSGRLSQSRSWCRKRLTVSDVTMERMCQRATDEVTQTERLTYRRCRSCAHQV